MNKPLIELAIIEPPVHIQDMTVKEMWDMNLGWKLKIFGNFLPSNVLKELASHELIADEEVVDELYWNGSPNVDFPFPQL